jgi:hypothetical protein
MGIPNCIKSESEPELEADSQPVELKVATTGLRAALCIEESPAARRKLVLTAAPLPQL